MKRILPEEVKLAYDETHLRPIRGLYATPMTTTCGACALTAVAVHRGAVSIEHVLEQDRSTCDIVLRRLRDTLCEALGIDLNYSHGFTNGFDGFSHGGSLDSPFCTGVLDGRAAAALVFGEPTQ